MTSSVDEVHALHDAWVAHMLELRNAVLEVLHAEPSHGLPPVEIIRDARSSAHGIDGEQARIAS